MKCCSMTIEYDEIVVRLGTMTQLAHRYETKENTKQQREETNDQEVDRQGYLTGTWRRSH